ncbi:MAG: multidrug transporter [Planctomycetes bacterium]|nr:multidrug transporter [Planctomycetota bacterium]
MSEQIRNRVFLWTAVVTLAGGGALLATWILGHGKGTGRPLDPNQPAGKMAPKPVDHNEVTLSPAQQTKGGIAVAPLNLMSFQEKVTAYGTVSDTQQLSDSRSRFADAQAKQESAQAELVAAREEYTRAQSLYKDNRSTSEKAVQKAQATWLSDQAQARAAEVALHSQTALLRQQWGPVIAQWIEENSAPLVRLMDQEEVLIQITVPVGTKLLSPPPSATIETPVGKTETATCVSASPRTDPRIQGFSFFYRAPAKATGLLPGMNIVASLPTGQEIRGIDVPASAVVWLQGRAWIYVQTSPDTFVRREIPTNTPVSGGWFVREGFSAGQWCVVRGAQLLLSQEAHRQAQKGKKARK